jgi:hypothetical protein
LDETSVIETDDMGSPRKETFDERADLDRREKSVHRGLAQAILSERSLL